MEDYDIAISVVACKTNKDVMGKCINSILNVNLRSRLYVIDNSPEDDLRSLCNSKIEYRFNGANLGFGAAHNIAIKETIENDANYHLVLNPDVYFEKGVIEELYNFMENNPDIGMVMPKILYPDGSVQRLCKLLPSPWDLIRRRFLPEKLFSRQNFLYEMRFTGYNKIMDVPYLSGCFMFIRTEALNRAGLFDERFFMYLEDVDISRRIHKHYRTVYYPKVSVFHKYEKGSYKNSKLLLYHLFSAVKYFNKWGYFFDKERREINKKVIEKLNVQ